MPHGLDVQPLLEIASLKIYFQNRKPVVKAVDGVNFTVAPDYP
jgi:ABC-type oligopeptide transport system ATPase subunit